jgi:hypothetical protein
MSARVGVQVKLTNMEGVVKFVKDEMPVKALEIENGGLRLKLRGGYRGCVWHGIWVFGVWWSPGGSSFWAGCCCRRPPKLTLLLSFLLLLFFCFLILFVAPPTQDDGPEYLYLGPRDPDRPRDD